MLYRERRRHIIAVRTPIAAPARLSNSAVEIPPNGSCLGRARCVTAIEPIHAHRIAERVMLRLRRRKNGTLECISPCVSLCTRAVRLKPCRTSPFIAFRASSRCAKYPMRMPSSTIRPFNYCLDLCYRTTNSSGGRSSSAITWAPSSRMIATTSMLSRATTVMVIEP